jgi:hypothetical protein
MSDSGRSTWILSLIAALTSTKSGSLITGRGAAGYPCVITL